MTAYPQPRLLAFMPMRRASLWLMAALAVVLVAPAPASARAPMHVGIADDASLFGDPGAADRTIAQWQRAGVDTVRIQVSWARVAPDPAAVSPPPGFNAKDPDSPGYRWDVIDRAVDRVDRRRHRPDLDDRRSTAPVGLGEAGR